MFFKQEHNIKKSKNNINYFSLIVFDNKLVELKNVLTKYI